MSTPCSGKICLSDVRSELGLSGKICLGDAKVRGLAGVPSGKICLGDLRCKSDIEWQQNLLFVYSGNNDTGYPPFNIRFDERGGADTPDSARPVPTTYPDYISEDNYRKQRKTKLPDQLVVSDSGKYVFCWQGSNRRNATLVTFDKQDYATTGGPMSCELLPQSGYEQAFTSAGVSGALITRDDKYVIIFNIGISLEIQTFILPNGKPSGNEFRMARKSGSMPWSFANGEFGISGQAVNPKWIKGNLFGCEAYGNSGIGVKAIHRYDPAAGLSLVRTIPDGENHGFVGPGQTENWGIFYGRGSRDNWVNDPNLLIGWSIDNNGNFSNRRDLIDPYKYWHPGDWFNQYQGQWNQMMDGNFCSRSPDGKWFALVNIYPPKAAYTGDNGDGTAINYTRRYMVYFCQWSDASGWLNVIPWDVPGYVQDSADNGRSRLKWITWSRDNNYITIGGDRDNREYLPFMQTYLWDGNNTTNPVGKKTWDMATDVGGPGKSFAMGIYRPTGNLREAEEVAFLNYECKECNDD